MKRAKDLLDRIEEGNKKKNKEKNEARVPEVGIIYYINQELFIDGTPVKEAEKYGDFRVHSKDHFSYWEDELSSSNSPIQFLTKQKDYDYYPRGRVVYDVPKDTFYVYLDKCIIDHPDIVKQIIFLLHLPETKCEVSRDRHYQCSKCNRDYVE